MSSVWSRPKRKVRKYEVNGELLTISQISNMANMSYEAVSRRIKTGESAQDTVDNGKLSGGRRKNTHELNGKIFTIYELAKEFDVSISFIRDNLRQGLDIDKAVLMSDDGRRRRYNYKKSEKDESEKETSAADVNKELSKKARVKPNRIPVVFLGSNTK